MATITPGTTQAPAAAAASQAAGLSSIGAKSIVALTGMGLTLFVIAHMVGNLQLFLGPDALNAYATKLKEMPELLWTARIGLLTIFVVHIGLTLWLAVHNRQARPVGYVFPNTRAASIASRTMVYSGLALLAFTLLHLAHYTFGLMNPEYLTAMDPKNRHDVYSMVVRGFRVWWVSLLYIISMLLLGLHLSHGVSSMFQSLGLNRPRYNPWIQRGGLTVAWVLMIGNISMPVAVLLGFVKLPGEM